MFHLHYKNNLDFLNPHAAGIIHSIITYQVKTHEIFRTINRRNHVRQSE